MDQCREPWVLREALLVSCIDLLDDHSNLKGTEDIVVENIGAISPGPGFVAFDHLASRQIAG